MIKSLQGIMRQQSREKFVILSIKPQTHVRILLYRMLIIIIHFLKSQASSLAQVLKLIMQAP